jgi:hypothetical protein
MPILSRRGSSLIAGAWPLPACQAVALVASQLPRTGAALILPTSSELIEMPDAVGVVLCWRLRARLLELCLSLIEVFERKVAWRK